MVVRSCSEIWDSIRESYENVTPGERKDFTRELESVLRELICRNLREDVDTDMECPHCRSCQRTKYGHTYTGKQRFMCGNCRRTYSEGSCRNLLSNSKLPAETWLLYCSCFVSMYSLRKSAMVCGVSLGTSFFMRRRILEILFEMLPPFRAEAGSEIQIDEMYLGESFKGPDKGGRIPRPSRKRGKGTRPGLSRELVCVATGINDAGDVFFDIAGRGKPSFERMRTVLEDRICSGTIVTTDREQSYVSVLGSLGVGEHIAHDDREYGHLSRIDSYHSRIRHFLYRFRGVSTRWLTQYLGWQKFLESFGDCITERSVFGRIIKGHYSGTRSRIRALNRDGNMFTQ